MKQEVTVAARASTRTCSNWQEEDDMVGVGGLDLVGAGKRPGGLSIFFCFCFSVLFCLIVTEFKFKQI